MAQRLKGAMAQWHNGTFAKDSAVEAAQELLLLAPLLGGVGVG
jgi:hypothetical protein